MYRILLLSCLSALCFGASAEPSESRFLRDSSLFPSGRIVGGFPLNITDVPYIVALENDGFHFCGGSLVSDQHVVTAAHCVGYTEITGVRVGATTRGKGGKLYKVNKIHRHSQFDSLELDYDVGVIELKEKVQFSDSVKPIQLTDSVPAPGSKLQISGWGTLTEDGELPSNLQSVYVPAISYDHCRKMYATAGMSVTERMMCAYESGKDSCQGDSGGPVVSYGKLAGIVSWGMGCARPNFAGVNTNVAHPSIRDFIRTHTGM